MYGFRDVSSILVTSIVLIGALCMEGHALAKVQQQQFTSMGWPLPLSNDDCWRKMPTPSDGAKPPLPSWIRMVAREMPRTAAAFLELDYAQRTAGPVEPKLKAAMRWVVARENKCDYTMKIAESDARRFGVSAEQWLSLTDGDRSLWNENDRAALEFALGMTLDSEGVSDEQFQKMIDAFNERVAAAFVLHMAYANFQDRLVLSLGVSLEPVDLAPPNAVKFSLESLASKQVAPPNQVLQTTDGIRDDRTSEHGGDLIKESENYTWLPYERLQERLQIQRVRRTRLRIPDWQEFAGLLPPGLMPSASDIVWYKIVFGYAHELAVPFEVYLRTAGSEISANWDRKFGNSLFWIVTDAIKCPYCMGHCEMNWEVAGLDRSAIAEISRKLAGDDWSSFSAAEQRALDFARKLTKAPGEISKTDMDALRQGFGDQRAFFIAVNTSRYNYMTRISNGFQLTLETGNPFYQYFDITPQSPVELSDAPRPTPLRRGEMKKWLEDMKNRRERVSLPPMTETEKSGENTRNASYESRLSQLFLPNSSGARGYLNFSGSANREPRPGDNRAAQGPDPTLTLDYGFKTRLFWIASRVNNCQYCLGHQESKLLAVGMSDEQIAALDLDWSAFPVSEQSAFGLAKRLTEEPQSLTDEDFEACRRHFADLQILEMVLSVAGNNAINRWKEGIGVPQSGRGGNFGPTNTDNHSYLTATNPDIAAKTSKIIQGNFSNDGPIVIETTRHPAKVVVNLDEGLAAVKNRTARLPMKSVEETRATFADLSLPREIPNWLRVLANFPVAGKRQALAFQAAENDLDLSELTRARIAWVIARQNGAWYSLNEAHQRLVELGQSREQILELESFETSESERSLTKRDKALLTVAKNLAASPVVLTDREAQLAIDVAGPREFVQTVHYTAMRSLFDRFTEACLLPSDDGRNP